MKGAWRFIKTALLGGVVVILPAAILATAFAWAFGIATRLIRPLTALLVARSSMGEMMADLIGIAIVIGFCFALGLAVRTAAGRLLQQSVERRLERFAPGYRLVKETLLLFLGRKKSPFSRVALVRLYGSDALTTAFVTEEHADGMRTVFVPTSPNPTSGLVFHLKSDCVFPVEASVEAAMRTVIACGAGSGSLLEGLKGLEKSSG